MRIVSIRHQKTKQNLLEDLLKRSPTSYGQIRGRLLQKSWTR